MSSEFHDENVSSSRKRIRLLGWQEQFYYWNHEHNNGSGVTVFAMIVQCSVPLHLDLVQEAADFVHSKFPILSCEVRKSTAEEVWLVEGRRRSVPVVQLESHMNWSSAHAMLLNGSLLNHDSDYLWTVHFLNNPSNLISISDEEISGHRSVVYLSFSHVIIDGTSVKIIIQQLLTKLNSSIQNINLSEKTIEPQPVSESLDTLFKHRLTGNWLKFMMFMITFSFSVTKSLVISALESFFRARNSKTLCSAMESRNLVIPAHLSRTKTALLLDRCRKHGVRVNSALSAALILSAQKVASSEALQYYFNDKEVNCLWMASLRRYLEPDQRHMIVNTTGYIYHQIPAVKETNAGFFWSLSAQIDKLISRSILNAEPFYSLRLNKLSMATTMELAKAIPVDLLINNYGCLESTANQTDSIKLEQLHYGLKTCRSVNNFFGMNFFATVNGSLCYTLSYLQGSTDTRSASMFADYVMEYLNQ